MNRSIKFRAWNKKAKGDMVYFDLAGLADNNVYLNLKSRDEVPMQFTGLTDKNGKEIYEGDIVRGNVSDEYDDGHTHLESVQIVFEEGAWLAKGIGTSENWPAYDFGYLDTVIGNIYENPELVEKA